MESSPTPSLIDHIQNFSTGYTYAHSLAVGVKEEKIMRAGHNIFMTGFFQLSITVSACLLINPCLKSLKAKKIVTIPLAAGSLASTFLLSVFVYQRSQKNKEILKKKEKDHTDDTTTIEQKWYDQLLLSLYNHVTDIALIATLTASVASIVFFKEHRYMGIATVIGIASNYGVNLAAEHQIIPHSVRIHLNFFSLCLAWATGLLFGKKLAKAKQVFSISCYLLNYYLKKQRIEEEQNYYASIMSGKKDLVPFHEFDTYQKEAQSKDTVPTCQTYANPHNTENPPEAILAPTDNLIGKPIENPNLKDVKLHTPHLYSCTQIPEAPEDADLDDLLSLFDTVPWKDEEILTITSSMMQEDEEWITKQDPSKIDSDASYKNFLRSNLQDYIRHIKTKNIQYGEPKEYQSITDLAKWVGHYLKKKNEDEDLTSYHQRIAKTLIPLAQSAHYCGAGVYEPTLTAYLNTINLSSTANLQLKILAYLSSMREQIFRSILPDMGFFVPEVTKWDRHDYGSYVETYGRQLGLPSHKMAENDSMFEGTNTEIFNKISSAVFKICIDNVKKEFWSSYTPTFIVNSLIDPSPNLKLSLEEIQTWYTQYFQRELAQEKHDGKAWSDLTENQKSALQPSIHKSLEDTFNFDTLQKAPTYIWKVILREMGIFEKLIETI